MTPAAIIAKKRDGHRLDASEIRFLVEGFSGGAIADYQMSAFAMAVCIRGMDSEETACLTEAMLRSGSQLARLDDTTPRVDKHSTGGLGDKTSLVLAPLLACCDLHVPMISGRGLGLTGGTLDKLESIPGFRVDLEEHEIASLLSDVGCCIVAATETIAPADRRLYALRDTSATVESVALITSSILSKKLAASLDALVMDVKVGAGGFMPSTADARLLAQSLRRTAAHLGLPLDALLTDMDQPLGSAVGNAVEVNEAIDVLQCRGPVEVRDLTIELAARPLVRTTGADSLDEARQRLRDALDSGAAYERFRRMVALQGGRLGDGPLPLHPPAVITAENAGVVHRIDARQIGEAIVEMGGGRRRKDDAIDSRVGILVHARVGDVVQRNQPLLTLLAADSERDRYARTLRNVAEVRAEPAAPHCLILDFIE